MEGQGDPPNLAAVPGAAAVVPGGDEDRLSHLPDHLLVLILLKLGTKQAAQTSVLSWRWPGVWVQVPFLEFRGVESSVPARALAVYQAYSELDIHGFTVYSNQMDVQHTTAWLSLAAPLLSGRLYFDNIHTVPQETRLLFLDDDEEAVMGRGAFELPCFWKATEILMDLGFLGLALPPAGVFDALRLMWLENFWFRRQLTINDTMFPSLQEVTIRRVRGLVELTLESESLLYVHLSLLLQIQRLNIRAPRLRSLEVKLCFYNVPGPVASITAERLDSFRWEVPCVPELRVMTHLRLLGAPSISTHYSEDICADFLRCFQKADHLDLAIVLGPQMNGSPLLMEGITIPYVGVLWLYLHTNGHVFEGRVLELLTKCSGIRKLNLSFQDRDEVQDFCLPDCICHDEPEIWRSKVYPMRALKIVDIIHFHGAPREVQFLEQLVRRAPRLEVFSITMFGDHPLGDIESSCPKECRIIRRILQRR